MPAYSIVRSIEIEADTSRVFEVVADFGTWTVWSPWLIAEPEARVTVSSDGKSVGSVYSWVGELTGQGEVEHKELVPYSRIEDEIRFLKPFKSQARVGFLLEPTATGTMLSWYMEGSMPWFMFWMIPMMKTFISMDYSRGLKMLKDWIETGSIPSKVIQHGVQQTEPLRMAGVSSTCEVETVGPSMEAAFEKARELFRSHGLPMNGPAISVYTKFRMSKGVFEYISGFVIPADADVPASSGLKEWSIGSAESFRVEHIGSYRHLGNAWSVANQVTRYRKLKQQRCGTYEIYRTTPPESPESELKTDIYLPLR
ncbi:MAG: SRPBCC family protein [Planctomycetaceae bacterium]|nr:SRPBCC family protein [Planctomycetaceae bacterium]